MAMTLAAMGSLDRAEELARHSIETLERLEAWSDLGHVVDTLATIRLARGDAARALELADRSLALEAEHGPRRRADRRPDHAREGARGAGAATARRRRAWARGHRRRPAHLVRLAAPPDPVRPRQGPGADQGRHVRGLRAARRGRLSARAHRPQRGRRRVPRTLAAGRGRGADPARHVGRTSPPGSTRATRSTIERTVALAVARGVGRRRAPRLPGPRGLRAARDGAVPRRDRGRRAVPGRARSRRSRVPRAPSCATSRRTARSTTGPRATPRRRRRSRGPCGGSRSDLVLVGLAGSALVAAGTRRGPRGGRGGVRGPGLRGGRLAAVAGAGRAPCSTTRRRPRPRRWRSSAASRDRARRVAARRPRGHALRPRRPAGGRGAGAGGARCAARPRASRSVPPADGSGRDVIRPGRRSADVSPATGSDGRSRHPPVRRRRGPRRPARAAPASAPRAGPRRSRAPIERAPVPAIPACGAPVPGCRVACSCPFDPAAHRHRRRGRAPRAPAGGHSRTIPPPPPDAREHVVRVRYGGADGPDLAGVAAGDRARRGRRRRPPRRAPPTRSCSWASRPGSPTSASCPGRLALPRLATPRTRVPGRERRHRRPPDRRVPGRLARAAGGSSAGRTPSCSIPRRTRRSSCGRATASGSRPDERARGRPGLEVLEPGLLATVQDGGRPGLGGARDHAGRRGGPRRRSPIANAAARQRPGRRRARAHPRGRGRAGAATR